MNDNERKPAKPIQYKQVYLGEVFPPQAGQGSTIQEIGDAILSESPCIVFEFRDIEAAIKEGIDKGMLQGISNEAMSKMVGDNPDLGTLRFYLNIPTARHLACHLIHALARTGDRIAMRLEEQIEPAIAEAAEAEGRPNPFLHGLQDEENDKE